MWSKYWFRTIRIKQPPFRSYPLLEAATARAPRMTAANSEPRESLVRAGKRPLTGSGRIAIPMLTVWARAINSLKCALRYVRMRRGIGPPRRDVFFGISHSRPIGPTKKENKKIGRASCRERVCLYV